MESREGSPRSGLPLWDCRIPPSPRWAGVSFSAAPSEDLGVNGKDGSGSSEGRGSVSKGMVTAGRVSGGDGA